jgi:hypothetical protein
MKLPKIENQIKVQEKKALKLGAFISLGLSAAATTIEPAIALLIPFVAIHVISDVVGVELFLNDHKKEKWFTSNIFKKKLNNWFENYIKNSETLTEQKYKAIFFSLWLKHKEIPLNDLIDSQQIKNLAEELLVNKETVYYLPNAFQDNVPYATKLTKKEINLEKFLEEDKKNPRKINIAKKVYEEFSHMGLAAKLFVTGKDFSHLLYLQDYKFSDDDYELIKKFTTELKIDAKTYSILYLNAYSQNTINAVHQLINYENSLDNLKILNSYCEQLEEKGYAKNMEHASELKKTLNSKINYLNMEKEIGNNKTNLNKPKKI